MPPKELVSALLSKLLGYVVISGACIAKVPQIMNIVKANNADGLSAVSYELESLGFLVHAGYGYVMGLPFLSWGEVLALLAQNVVILYLVYKFSKAPLIRGLATSSALVALISTAVTGSISKELIGTLYNLNNVVMIASRVPQIIKNYKEKSTGQLSSISCGMNLMGATIRIFTSLQANAPALVRTFVLSWLLNSTLFFQIFWYAKGKAAKKAKKE